jgi:hypothetical protein
MKILLSITFPNRKINGYFKQEGSLEHPYIVVSTQEVDEKKIEFRLHLDPQKIIAQSGLVEDQTYQGSLLSSDIVAQEIECKP